MAACHLTHPSTHCPNPSDRSGADKVSIGSDAVLAVEQYLARGKQRDGSTAIEQISRVYGAQVSERVRSVCCNLAGVSLHAFCRAAKLSCCSLGSSNQLLLVCATSTALLTPRSPPPAPKQAVVVSIDPKRVWVADPATTTHHCVKSSKTGACCAPGSAVGCFVLHCCRCLGRWAGSCTPCASVTTCSWLPVHCCSSCCGSHCHLIRFQSAPRPQRRAVVLVAVHGQGRARGARCGRGAAGAGAAGEGRGGSADFAARDGPWHPLGDPWC